MQREADSQLVELSATQLLINVLREAHRPLTFHEIFGTVCRVAGSLGQRGLAVSNTCRSVCSDQVRSEDVEESLWYWVANGFVVETEGQNGMALSESGRRLLEDDNLVSSIGLNLDEQTMVLLRAGIRAVPEG